MKLGTFYRSALALAGGCIAAAALAQAAAAPPPPRTAAAPPAPSGTNLQLPTNPVFLGDTDVIRKATAIVNGTVITGTDVDQRLALIVLANGGQVPQEEMTRLREQVLRNLVDETLQIQAAEQHDIKVEPREVDAYYARYAQSFGQSAQQFSAYLRSHGSSAESVKRQIHGEMSWQRLLRNRIEPFVNVSEEEVKSVIDRLTASKGTQEYKVSEIFLSATPETAPQARANADRIVQQLRAGGSFLAYARQFSEASTAAVGGDLGWVRAEQLPDPLAAAVRQIPVGAVTDPIAIPGGFSILAVTDTRQILTADPRDAQLSLKQITITIAPNTPRPQVEQRVQDLVRATQSMGGCGGAEAAAAAIKAEVVSNDQVKIRDLPTALQPVILGLQVGQPTSPFGSLQERVSVLVLCGRDDPPPVAEVSAERIREGLSEERINMRARRYLRDLRRDAVVDYR
ncbi:MAG: peptidylprolyl isomerase [Alphaproteobacteria bacterium]|nr:peptidylprolyl isomerase [Alphaproteobacteria bacterium]MBV9372460.1 peptidylprolyl isomerase [Alphaproteobacteria bacterium]MBV9902135.1 peptidylprolyl isomerase [Alphaproteobacteria bacterium]